MVVAARARLVFRTLWFLRSNYDSYNRPSPPLYTFPPPWVYTYTCTSPLLSTFSRCYCFYSQ